MLPIYYYVVNRNRINYSFVGYMSPHLFLGDGLQGKMFFSFNKVHKMQ